jgi:hypothetical protein
VPADARFVAVEDAPAAGVRRLRFEAAGRPLLWREALALWAGDPDFAAAFAAALAAHPEPAFLWEAPRLTTARLGAVFESVTLPAPGLARPADPGPFSAALGPAGASGGAVAFRNLGGDAELVAPRDAGTGADHAHLTAFLRSAPAAQVAALWRLAAERAGAWIVPGDFPWLSASGHGVAWLHLRLDRRPKYFAHAPYRAHR